MAQYYFPLHVVDGNNFPLYGTTSGSENLTSTNGGYGATGGLANLNSGDGSTRDKVYRVVTSGSRQYIFTSITGTTLDAVVRFRTSKDVTGSYDFGLIVRGAISQSNANVINGYTARVSSHASSYRDLQFLKWTGTTSQGFALLSSGSNHFPALTNASDVLSTYRYLRLQADSSSITAYGWWEGASETDQQASHVITDTNYASGFVGFGFEPNSLVDIDFVSIGTGTDDAPLTADNRELNAIVYQPQQGGNSTIPALGYDVRAYYLATGSPVGYGVSSLTDGTVSIQQLKFGEQPCVLNAVDLDNNPQQWKRAVSQPVTPVLSV